MLPSATAGLRCNARNGEIFGIDPAANLRLEIAVVITVELVHPLQQKVVQSWKFDSSCQSISIGRSRQNEITLMSAVVSRHHAVMRRDERGWCVEALGANGCFIEDKPVQKAYLHSGTVVRIAKTGPRLRFVLDTEVEAPRKQQRLGRQTERVKKEDILSARETWLGDDKD